MRGARELGSLDMVSEGPQSGTDWAAEPRNPFLVGDPWDWMATSGQVWLCMKPLAVPVIPCTQVVAPEYRHPVGWICAELWKHELCVETSLQSTAPCFFVRQRKAGCPFSLSRISRISVLRI